MGDPERPSGDPPGSAGLYREIFRNSTDTMLVVSLGGRILEANPAAEALLGFPLEELLRTPASALLPAAVAKELPAILREAEQKGRNTKDLEALRGDGSILPVEASSSLVSRGGERAFLVIVRDISERRRAEEALRASEDRYRSLVETCPDAVTLTDLEGHFLMVNRQAARIHGVETPEEFLALGLNAFDPVAPEDRERAARNAEKTLREGAVRAIEYQLLRHDGSSFAGELSASVLRDGKGAPQGFIAVIRDVSERKRHEREIQAKSREIEAANAELRRLNEQLEARNRAFTSTVKRLEEIRAWMTESEKMRSLGTLAGGVAHEFNNLLGVILGCASGLQTNSALAPEAREYVGMIRDASRRAAEFSRQLLGLVQKAKADPQPFSLNDTVGELGRLLSLTFPKNVSVETDLAPDLPPALGTPAQVHQALLNLCVNSRDAMPAGGRLTLRTAAAPDGPSGPLLAVTVSDTGEGIPPENLERIFEPFFTTKPPGLGTGLGLSFVKSAAEALGGRVEVRSEPGKGAAFTLFLPAGPGRPAPASPRAPPGPARRSGSLLVVDDDAVNRTVLEKILAGNGHRVATAADGAAALRRLAEAPRAVDLVILDLGMPGMSGEETLRRILQEHPGLPVAIVTGMADASVSEDLRRAGAFAFIPKPFDARRILQVVRDALGRRASAGAS